MPGILIIEDDADIAALIAHYLQKSVFTALFPAKPHASA
jgi:DNA-binding response OmpR family regulator